jgi:signal peptidase II
LKSKIRDYSILFLVAGIIVALDQYSKWAVRTKLALGEMWLPSSLEWLMPYARIVHWYNKGAAFGMFQGLNIVFAILAVIVIGFIIYYYPRVDAIDWWLKLAMCFQLSGAAGNLLDRLFFGQVTDFISVGTFPVWNVADTSITIGVAILLVGVWWKERSEKKKSLLNPTSGETAPELSDPGADQNGHTGEQSIE